MCILRISFSDQPCNKQTQRLTQNLLWQSRRRYAINYTASRVHP